MLWHFVDKVFPAPGMQTLGLLSECECVALALQVELSESVLLQGRGSFQ